MVTVPETPVDIGSLIERTLRIKGGRPVIKGTGVTVHRIVGWYKLGLNAEEIAREIGHVTVGQVHAALAYFHANEKEIQALLDKESADFEKVSALSSGQKRPGR